MNSIIKSIYWILKSNDGLFLSEKQSAFFTKNVGNKIVQDTSFSLGSDYNNKRVGKGSQRIFVLDNKGVVSVVSNNAKGTKTLFCRKQGINMFCKKEQIKTSKNERETIKNIVSKLLKNIDATEYQLQDTIRFNKNTMELLASLKGYSNHVALPTWIKPELIRHAGQWLQYHKNLNGSKCKFDNCGICK